MKKIFLLLSFYLCVSFMMFSTDSIQGEGSGKRIIISGRDKHTVMHLVEPSVTILPRPQLSLLTSATSR